MGPGILPETTVGKHNPPCHLQMPTKALSCTKKAICEHGPEALSCPVGQGSFKMDCFKVEKCSMVRRDQIRHSCWKSRTLSSGLKRRETFQHVRGGKSTKIFYSSKSTITLLKFYLSTSKSTSLKIYSSKSKK